jgi:hypothetical protein
MIALAAPILLQLLLAWHAVKTGRAQPWLWVLLAIPGLGAIAYIAVELLPAWFGSAHGRRTASVVADGINPGRHYRALAQAAEAVPTVENRARLAHECRQLGRHAEAARLYEDCLQGIHAEDPKLFAGLAQARFSAGDALAPWWR